MTIAPQLEAMYRMEGTGERAKMGAAISAVLKCPMPGCQDHDTHYLHLANVWEFLGGTDGGRLAVTLTFTCELCGGVHRLDIVNEKGQTVMTWRDD